MSASLQVTGDHRPRIGVSVHCATVVNREGIEEVRFEVAARYAAAVVEAGGVPLLLPTHPDAAPDPEAYLATIDGLLLTGGGSLPASYFVDHPEPSLRDTNPPRYDFEVALVRAANAAGMPLLGICRGHQTLAEALGGTLLADLRTVPGNAEHYQTSPATEPTHSLRTAPGSLLGRSLPTAAHVNSFHRQAVVTPPPGWRATAWSPDGLIEAIEADDGFGLGCQFHPEWLGESEPGFAALFSAFVAAARLNRG